MAMSNLKVWSEFFRLNDEQSEVNIIQLDDQSFWFQFSHLAKLLGYSNPTVALQTHCEDYEVRKLDIGMHELVNFVSESGFYSLVLGSQKPIAKQFKKWVCSEVLPKLRSQGGYIMPDATLAQLEGLESQIRVMKADIERADMVIAAQGDRIEVLENECKTLLEPSIYRQAIERLIATQLRYRSGVNSWVPLSNLYSRLQSVWESWYTDVPMPSLSEFAFAARTYFEGVHKRKDHPIKMDLNCPLGDVINCELVSPKTAEIDPGIVKTIKLMTGGKVR